MFQRGEHGLTMSLRQVWDFRRERANEVRDAFGPFAGGRRGAVQERFERHADDG
ncbi:MAG TPA: hypothetical protein VEL51_09855 [Vicinamibacterales bacterium]|nr:hypothetical protein [Vicinamibacterales bacterium]